MCIILRGGATEINNCPQPDSMNLEQYVSGFHNISCTFIICHHKYKLNEIFEMFAMDYTSFCPLPEWIHNF